MKCIKQLKSEVRKRSGAVSASLGQEDEKQKVVPQKIVSLEAHNFDEKRACRLDFTRDVEPKTGSGLIKKISYESSLNSHPAAVHSNDCFCVVSDLLINDVKYAELATLNDDSLQYCYLNGLGYHHFSSKFRGRIKWGVRKKISSKFRCRKNKFSMLGMCQNEASAFEEEQQKQELQANSYVCQQDTWKEKNWLLKVPKNMQGRWATERYRAAQLKLLSILHEKNAVPGKPLLRPALRAAARKHIGDTGLLDHLLKHMTDTVVADGQRFRRRHNSEGIMEYWLEDACLVELRRRAGVEPFWIPPPGWKPGDSIHNSTHVSLEEIKQLKDSLMELQSKMQFFTNSMDVDNNFLDSDRPSWETFKDSIHNQIRDMNNDLMKVKEAIRKHQMEDEAPLLVAVQDAHENSLDRGTNVESMNATRIIHGRLGKLDVDVRILAEAVSLNYNKLWTEKEGLKAQMNKSQRVLAALEDGVTCILHSLCLNSASLSTSVLTAQSGEHYVCEKKGIDYRNKPGDSINDERRDGDGITCFQRAAHHTNME